MKREGIAFVISAPSGTGKTTVCKKLKEKMPELKFSVSHTTRSIREGEKDGEDYFFVAEKEFKEKIERGDFVEWAKVHKNYYGTALETLRQFQKQGQDTLLDLDVQGAESLRKLNFPAVFIFILPPSIDELTRRLNARGTESAEIIKQRVDVGKEEIKKYALYDYVTTNREIEEAVDALMTIIRAERLRSSRFVSTSPDMEALMNPKQVNA